MQVVVDFLTNYIFHQPAILLGLIAMAGLLLQKKQASDVIKGTFLTAIGMFILDQGTSILMGSISPINAAMQASGTGGVASTALDGASFTSEWGGVVGIVMVLALVLHVLVARFTRFKVIFLCGHFIWWFPFVYTAAGVEAGLSGVALVIVAALVTTFQFSVMPWIIRKYVAAVNGDGSWTLGHCSTTQGLIAGFISSKVGDKSKSTEDLKVPKWLGFFREISVSGAVILWIVFIVFGIFFPTLSAGEPLVIYGLKQGLLFGAGLTIMLTGVRLLISQIVPAFKGISEKVVPNAIPGFDCPMLFSYRPNAVIIGFITTLVCTTLLMVLCNAMNIFGVMLIPMVIISFFECGGAAVIADAQGGLKGTIISMIVVSVAVVGLTGVSAMLFSNTIRDWLLVYGGNDLSLIGSIMVLIGRLFA